MKIFLVAALVAAIPVSAFGIYQVFRDGPREEYRDLGASLPSMHSSDHEIVCSLNKTHYEKALSGIPKNAPDLYLSGFEDGWHEVSASHAIELRNGEWHLWQYGVTCCFGDDEEVIDKDSPAYGEGYRDGYRRAVAAFNRMVDRLRAPKSNHITDSGMEPSLSFERGDDPVGVDFRTDWEF